MEPRRLTLAYSPDADDAFMMDGLLQQASDTHGLRFEPVTADIETLNRRALAGEIDVTAISFAAWPRFAELYDLLPVGCSFGLGYGPKVLARTPLEPAELASRVVGVPGMLTSAALTLKLMLPGVRVVEAPFNEVAAMVAGGELEAGVVIHEAQLTWPRERLSCVVDLGEWWAGETGGLPLPLGGNAIRAALPASVKADAVAALRGSIEHALAHRGEAVSRAQADGRGLPLDLVDRYVGLYVNELTLDAGARGRAAVDAFYARAAAAGLIPSVTARWA